tara:strand:+ start:13957 stop:15108 length:1152 start_codon:yes stop_codon:yes gene_type:complete
MFKKTTAIKKIQKLNKRIRIVQGGTSASKTFGILAILIDYSIKNSKTETSIIAESIPHLRRGAIRDFKKIMESTKRWNPLAFNRSLLTYTFANGSTMEFFSADSDAKLRGARRDVCYINEANQISFESYFQLAVRTRRHIYLDFNPTSRFWANEELEHDEEADWLVLTYKDNEAAPQTAIDEIERAKAKGDKGNEYWKNWFRVYGQGLTGTLQGAIFTNWTEGLFKEFSKVVFGQDYGMRDPTTLIKTSIDKANKKIYVKECFYQTNLTASQIADLNNKYAGQNLIVGDSAEPRLIQSLSKTCNLVPAVKGQGSITFGITMLQDYDLIIDPSSTNLINELRNYRWLEKKSQTPIDAFNHCIDALRYAVSHQLVNPYANEYYVY